MRRLGLLAGATNLLAASAAIAADGGTAVSDAAILALSVKHCVACHAKNPTHPSVRAAPKNVGLESVGELRRHAVTIYRQTVKTRAMPLGNQTAMTGVERAMLGAWIRALR